MNRMKLLWLIIRRNGCKILCTALVSCAAFGWWGVLYPQFALNRDTYCIVLEDGAVQNWEDVVEWEADDTVYLEILNADSAKVRIRSKLLKDAIAFWERLSKE